MLQATPSLPKTTSLSKAAELLLKLGMVIVGPLFLLGVLEGVAFVWEHKEANGPYAWELVASRRIDLVEYSEPGAGYTLMKPGSHYVWQRIPVDINSHGLRDVEIPFQKPLNTVRILNLGDSVAMGWGVRQEETYGKQLEKLLNRQAADGTRFEVINAGVPGWNPENELSFLQAEGVKYQPDLILLDVTIVNDIYGKNALKTHKRPPVVEWLRTHTYSWPFLSVTWRWVQARAAGRDRIGVIDPPTEADAYFPLDPTAPRWDEVWGWITTMAQVAKAHHANFVLVLFPLEFQVVDENFPTVPQTVLIQKAAEQGIPTLDLLPTFRQACQNKPGGPCYREDHYLFADVWMHPSAYGDQVTTQQLAAFLKTLN